MRLHHLEIQAFGPFADRQAVDFDALSAQGLFLLNGPTGAGKSSVLDAVCFALYGSVPGARQAAKRLRSDHAAESLAPEVSLEFSVADRRFRVVRSPAWERPARRGGGTTTEQAHTLLSERIGSDWVQKSARNDEAGLELQSLLGMDKEQFTKVVMLPQGEFAAFLRADAKPRRELLQRLFSTARFEDLEKLFADEHQRTARRLAEQEDRQRHLFLRAVDEAGRHDLAPVDVGADPEAPDAWAATLQALSGALTERRDAATLDATELAGQSALADTALATLRQRRNRFAALAQLRAHRAEHEARAEEIADLREQARRHDEARGLAAHLRLDDEAASLLGQARARHADALDRLRHNSAADEYLEPGDAADSTALTDACAASSSVLAVLRAALPDEQRLLDVRAEREALESMIRRLDAGLDDAHDTITRLQRQRADDAGTLVPLREAADGLAHLRSDLAAVVAAEETVRQYGAATQRLAAADARYALASEQFLALKEEWLAKLQLRLEQAAQELAEQLEDGHACPVCGSTEHPAPVPSPEGERISLDEEQEARRLQAEAEAVQQEAREVRDRGRLEVAQLAARGGGTAPEDAAAATRTARSTLQAAEAADAECTAVEERIRRAVAEEDTATEKRDTLREERAAAGSRQSSLTDQDAELSRRLAGLQADAPSLAARIDAVQHAHDDLDRVRKSLEALAGAEGVQQENARRLEDALRGTPFDTADEARSALLPEDRAAGLAVTLKEYEQRGHRLDAAEDDDAVRETLREEQEGILAPTDDDEHAAAATAEDLRGRAHRAGIGVEVLGHSVVQLESYARQLADLEQDIAPLREEAQLAAAVAETARGGGENLYKMSLATYVLASRLEQVADAATERLLQMSDGRYQLVHSDATAGNRRSGLGLNVIDGWTGNRRDTSTLSGGESFMASLALALGLADVVQQEAGGLDIETLFVDEGFGSLDDQALEQVMDALEGLRSGGRVVGLVSHVPELKQRVSAQLQVVKGRQGSVLRYVEQPASV
ncbi:SMC family ATPase [Arthrobacter pityocampae]|uniref:Nuclease SbcCD subunit C n=1 Tax=Arthrobacter pityocampae TaxID=547334 RepID=A0A2S5J1E2_9MICC|nr:SMC family ATPase [Arthrobacter pityocampae]PPB50652.1 SMC family ATPase [Arthrobacter pityocampae]